MSPQEFEQFSLRLLQDCADTLENSTFEHDVMMSAHDGTYQIDGKITFSYMGLDFVCLVECKRYMGPIKREKVAELYAKMQSLGAQKGIFVTTSYYQTGAMLFAKEHGIALIIITDEGMTYETRSEDVQEIHLPINGSMFVSVMTEATSENCIRCHYLFGRNSDALVDYLLTQ